MLAEALMLTACVFLLSGGLAFTLFMVQGARVLEAEPYPAQTVLAPVAMFVLSLGVMGACILALAGDSLAGDVALGKRQFYAGVSLVGACFVGMELLCQLAFT